MSAGKCTGDYKKSVVDNKCVQTCSTVWYFDTETGENLCTNQCPS